MQSFAWNIFISLQGVKAHLLTGATDSPSPCNCIDITSRFDVPKKSMLPIRLVLSTHTTKKKQSKDTTGHRCEIIIIMIIIIIISIISFIIIFKRALPKDVTTLNEFVPSKNFLYLKPAGHNSTEALQHGPCSNLCGIPGCLVLTFLEMLGMRSQMYHRIVVELHQGDSYKQHVRNGGYNWETHHKRSPKSLEEVEGYVLLGCTGFVSAKVLFISLAHESLRGRRIHYESQELVAANFNAILSWETIAPREPLWDTIVTIHCPTALDLEFKQPSKTFYVQMEYTLDCKTCGTCWFYQTIVKPNDL